MFLIYGMHPFKTIAFPSIFGRRTCFIEGVK